MNNESERSPVRSPMHHCVDQLQPEPKQDPYQHNPSTRLPLILSIASLCASIHTDWGMSASKICDYATHRSAP